MTNTVTYDSEVSTITNDQMQTAYALLWQTSPDFRAMMESIIEAGYTVTIKSVNGTSDFDTNPANYGATAYSETTVNNTAETATIKISEQLLQTVNYKTSYSPEVDSPITLERVIAHEMSHVWLEATSGTDTEENAAQQENKIMAAFHEAPRQGDPSSSQPHYDDSGATVSPHAIFGYGPHTIPTPVNGAETPWASAAIQSSPLVIDLSSGHTGVTLTTFDAATTATFFDIDGTGFASQTAWTSGDTGFLVRDLNSNGVIDNVSEMFGSPTVDGFAQLATLDSNHDLKIDAGDTAWSSLQVWTDTNGDGITEGGELHSLSSLGITSIDLAGVAPSTSTIDGNSISHTSTVTFSGGATSAIDDVWLTHSTVDTYYNSDYTIDLDTTSMLDLRGFGTVADLNVAMSGDSTLKSMVADFASGFSLASFADPSTLDSDVTNILYQWAGVESVDPSSRGPNVNAQDLEFLEHLFGQAFSQFGVANPWHDAGALVETSWQEVHDGFKADLLLQAGASSLFDSAVSYDPASGTIIGDMHLSETGIENLATYAPTSTDAAAQAFWVSVADFIDNTEGISGLTTDEQTWLDTAVSSTTTVGWDDIVNAYDHSHPGLDIIGTSGNDTLTGGTGDDAITGNGGNDTIDAGAGNDTITLGSTGNSVVHGGDGDDTINATGGNHTLYGDAGNDTIYAGDGVNEIHGGTGGNHITTGTGNTTYVFGGGDDFISDGGGTDQILLPTGITSSDLTFTRVSTDNSTTTFDDLLITVDGDAGGAIQIAGQFESGTQVETLVYSDSTTVDLTAITGYNIILTAGGDTYSPGLNIDQSVKGLDGNDEIVTGTGNDTLDGGNGNDYLAGGGGNDTYIASPGFDIIAENGVGGTDTINIPTGYSLSDLTFSRHIGMYGPDNNLIINIRGLGEIQVNDQFTSSGYAIENLYFLGDSSTVSLTGQVIQTFGTTGNDYIGGLTSGVGGNYFDGRGGNDNITGGTGDNTYLFSSGFGTNVINEPYHIGNSNMISFAGVDPSHIRMWTDSSGYLHLQDTTDTSHSITVDAATTGSGYAESTIGSYLEQITFDDSGHTTWDLTGGLTLTGDNSGDALFGTAYADTIIGGTGNDDIYGNGGNDTLISGGGADGMNGGDGNDTYVFASGFGNATVADNSSAGSNVIHITGIDPADIRMWTDFSGYLHIQDTADTSHSITVHAGTTGSGIDESTIGTYFSQITFDSGYSTTWDLTGGLNLANDSSGGYLLGTSHGDTLTGGSGVDDIYGNGGNDTLISGGGADDMNGGDGNDTYVFASGFGNAVVADNSSAGSNIIHITGIDPADIRMWTDFSGYLHIQDTADTSHSITVHAGTTGSGIDESTIGTYFSEITFDSSYSTTWDLTGGLNLANSNSGGYLLGTANSDTLTGGTGVDYIYGNGGDDVLYGGGGADSLTGGAGADTFLFKAATALGASVTIADFNTSDGDKIDIADVLDGHYDPVHDAIADFVSLTTSGSNTHLNVDLDGTGSTYSPTQIASLTGVTGLNLSDLITNGNLVVHT